MGFFVPDRRRGHEILDDDTIDAETRVRSIADVTRSNIVFGGRRAAVSAVSRGITAGKTFTVLDVGTGLADIPQGIVQFAARRNARALAIGLDEAVDLLVTARPKLFAGICGNARALPFRDASVDIVVCSQLLHHFATNELPDVIRELNRVARSLVVISDLRRSWIAAGGFWLSSFPLGFHPVTRHDGVVSVFRGFTAGELGDAVRAATGISPRVERRLGFRLTASWTPRAA